MTSKRARQAQQRPVADLVAELQRICGVAVDEPLLLRALTHRSYAYENGNLPHNERQEFLGDAVLGIVVTDTLYHTYPDEPEGQLAKYRASVVNSRALAGVARELGLGDYLLLGRGELATGGRDKDSILADTTEAVIGTVYLSGGMPPAAALVHHLVDGLMAQASGLGAGLDWKTSLQELCATQGLGAPSYLVDEEGPDHDKVFTAHAVVAGEQLGDGVGRNKKAAEQIAAEAAWNVLKERAAKATEAEPVVEPGA
ncbi:ribonuclease III [Calidifontibacter sp. DB0510]|uniref:Ribonuclease 3 n=1 Tax=Metallococcus carri TaxID=1656884 RepID=A0A967AWW0_9MICO|nr:ribonuclease III [Metallococcus carri]NHN54464.1 ribonuclease III [Metallococcus carri]NOP36697.1 ribonuclease III [Calidifontibacter sp. DB2511S]